jgi:hypothetical protein
VHLRAALLLWGRSLVAFGHLDRGWEVVFLVWFCRCRTVSLCSAIALLLGHYSQVKNGRLLSLFRGMFEVLFVGS